MSDHEPEPPGGKMAPKAVVARVSLYLRQLEAYQRQGCTTVSSSQLGDPLATLPGVRGRLIRALANRIP